MNKRQEIIKKHLLKKVKKLADIEKQLSDKDFISSNNDIQVSRKVIACFDGFIILRTFSKNYQKPFNLLASSERIGVFIKKGVPIRKKDGQFFNLYDLLINTIGLELKMGTKTGLGVNQGTIFAKPNQFDAFQILISPYSQQKEIEETINDIKFITYTDNEFQQLERKIDFIHKSQITQNPLIITEGKTDWKYLLAALRYFHNKNEFQEIKDSYFLKFGSQIDIEENVCGCNCYYEGSSSQLIGLLESMVKSRKIRGGENYTIIGIFDSDDRKVKCINDSQNKVFSFMIEPENISTEFLFSKDDLKKSDCFKRLYIGTEFDQKTKKLISNPKISLGGNSNNINKAGKNVIIDSDVFDLNGKNIAKSKENFASKIYRSKILISDISWENFRFIFNKILILLKNH